MQTAVKFDNERLQANVEQYAKNHFHHKTKKSVTPSLLRMAIHEEKDIVATPSSLKNSINEE